MPLPREAIGRFSESGSDETIYGVVTQRAGTSSETGSFQNIRLDQSVEITVRPFIKPLANWMISF